MAFYRMMTRGTELFVVSLYFCMACVSQDNPAQVTGLLHHSIRLSSNLVFPTLVLEVDWNFKSKEDSMKVAQFERQQPMFYNNQFHNRMELFDNGTTLHIKDLRMEDSGTYSSQIISTHHKNYFSYFLLTVYEPVPDPSIRIVEEKRTDHWCNMTLHCSAPTNSSPLNYSWIYRHNDSVYELSGEEILISLNYSWNIEFQCLVQNPADLNNVSKQAKCYEADGVVVRHRLYIPIFCLPLLLLFLLLFLVIWKIRRKGSSTLTEENGQAQVATNDSERHSSAEEEENDGEQIQQQADRLYCEPTSCADNTATQRNFSWHERDNHVTPSPRKFKTIYISLHGNR